MEIQASIDAVYRIAVDAVVVSGWCMEMEPSTRLHWQVEGGKQGCLYLGSDRVDRPDVLEALGVESGSSSAYGFELHLKDVPEQADWLRLELVDVAWICPIENRIPVSKGSIDAVFRVSADLLLVSGWSSEREASTPLRWSADGGANGEAKLGGTRLRRSGLEQVEQALDGGFLVAVCGVPALVERLHLSIADLSWECPVEDLREQPLGTAVDALLECCQWSGTPAERLDGLLQEQGLGEAILALIRPSIRSVPVDRAPLRLEASTKLVLLLLGSHSLDLIRLQLLALSSSISRCAESFDLCLLPNPAWALFTPVEQEHFTRLLDEHPVSLLPMQDALRPLEDVLNDRLGSAAMVVALGLDLVPNDRSVGERLELALLQPLDGFNPLGSEDSGFFRACDLARHGDACWLLRRQQQWEFRPAPKPIWSLMRDLGCLEPPLERGDLRGLSFWRDALQRFVLDAWVTGGIC